MKSKPRPAESLRHPDDEAQVALQELATDFVHLPKRVAQARPMGSKSLFS